MLVLGISQQEGPAAGVEFADRLTFWNGIPMSARQKPYVDKLTRAKEALR